MKSRTSSPPGSAVPRPQPGSPPPAVSYEASRDLIEADLAAGEAKLALARAKALYAADPGTETESLLIRATTSRVDSLIRRSMFAEADALLDLLSSRHPSATRDAERLRNVMRVRQGKVGGVVGPLADPECPPSVRREIETILREHLVDPGNLARCTVLPAEHSLRAAARSVVSAFDAVARGDVAEETIGLPEVSHRGPLAPWKMLIRAVWHFHRLEDAECRACLQAIPASTPPAALVPVLGNLVGDTAGKPISQAGEALIRSVQGRTRNLGAALKELDRVLEDPDGGAERKVIPVFRRAVDICREECPHILETLKVRITVHAVAAGFEPDRVRKAMGGPAIPTAEFYRLHAILHERIGESMDGTILATGKRIEACVFWEAYRRACIREQSPQADAISLGVLSLHMAEVLGSLRARSLVMARESFRKRRNAFLRWFRELAGESTDLAAAAADDLGFLDTSTLFRRAAAHLGDAVTFQAWISWARAEKATSKEAEAAALAWREARPRDVAPLPILVELAEGRGALARALVYLDAAETMDAMSPNVRAARLRLWLSSAIRHLKQGKPHLATKDFEELEQIPAFREGNRPALLAALRWVASCMESAGLGAGRVNGGPGPSGREAERWSREVTRDLADETAARILLDGIADLTGLRERLRIARPELPALFPVGAWAVTIARICGLLEGCALRLPTLPSPKQLARDLAGPTALTAPELLILAQSALRAHEHAVAYRACGAGLAVGGPLTARFLLVRAQLLPLYDRRRASCARAALALGREARDAELIHEFMDLVARPRSPLLSSRRALEDPLTPVAAQVIARWEARHSNPANSRTDGFPPDPTFDLLPSDCMCPRCRQRHSAGGAGGRDGMARIFGPDSERGENGPAGDESDDFDDEDDDDFDDEDDELDDDDDFDDEDNDGLDFGEMEVALLEILTGSAIPTSLAKALGEVRRKFGISPSRKLPPLESVQKRDPELFNRILVGLMEAELNSDEERSPTGPPPSGGRSKPKQRKRRP